MVLKYTRDEYLSVKTTHNAMGSFFNLKENIGFKRIYKKALYKFHVNTIFYIISSIIIS